MSNTPTGRLNPAKCHSLAGFTLPARYDGDDETCESRFMVYPSYNIHTVA